MTRKQLLWFFGLASVVVVGFIALHLSLPIDRTWKVNRLLHYGGQGGVGLAVLGAAVWLFWPRPKAPRRDEDRLRARRRLVGLAFDVLAAVALVLFAETHRENAARRLLETTAVADLNALGEALDRYAAEHGSKPPDSIAALAPHYVQPDRLYYAYRNGPVKAAPPALAAGETEETSYALARQLPVSSDVRKRAERDLVAYLRAGNAWAPLTAVLVREKGDLRAYVTGDDVVRQFEREAAGNP